MCRDVSRLLLSLLLFFSIAGNVGKVFKFGDLSNLVNYNLTNLDYSMHTYGTKNLDWLPFCQYQLRANLTNLMLAKVTH